MKTITFIEIEKNQIVISIDNALPDPEETNAKVNNIIAKNPNILLNKKREELLAENIVFSHLGKEQKNVDDAEGEKLATVFKGLDPHEKLLLSGNTIADWRNTEYFIKQAGIWYKQTIISLGKSLPPKAVLPEELSETQWQEIAEQNETERIANLIPEQKSKEKEAALTAAKREVRCLKEEAEIAGEFFDAAIEYQSRKSKIEKKYGQ